MYVWYDRSDEKSEIITEKNDDDGGNAKVETIAGYEIDCLGEATLKLFQSQFYFMII